jgi:hypothetical protein
MMCAQAKLGRRESYRSTIGTTRVGLILTLAWLLIISEAQQLFRRTQNLFCLPNAWLDLQEGHQVFDRLVEHFEGHWEDHLDKVPVLQRPEQLQAWRLAVDFCYHQFASNRREETRGMAGQTHAHDWMFCCSTEAGWQCVEAKLKKRRRR